MSDEKLKDFRLVGGTALSLCIGHRISIDIDLFTDQSFDAYLLKEYLEKTYNTDRLIAITNGVFGLIENIKVDLITHRYIWVKPVVELEGIRMASLEDIGAMKLHAIVQSGSRLKDYVDVYYLLERFSMNQLVSFYEEKYPESNRVLARNGLIYFDDIDFDIPVKLVNSDLNWKTMELRLKAAHLDRQTIFEPGKRSKGIRKRFGS
jgi:hypothetical protein